MMQEKTRGNLNADESRILAGTISNLQLSFVEIVRKQPSRESGIQPEAPPKPAQPAPENTEADAKRKSAFMPKEPSVMAANQDNSLTQQPLNLDARTQQFQEKIFKLGPLCLSDPAAALAGCDECLAQADGLERNALERDELISLHKIGDLRVSIFFTKAVALNQLARYDEAKRAVISARSYLTDATASLASQLDELEMQISQFEDRQKTNPMAGTSFMAANQGTSLTQQALNLQTRTGKFNEKIFKLGPLSASYPEAALVDCKDCLDEAKILEQDELDLLRKIGDQASLKMAQDNYRTFRFGIFYAKAQALTNLAKYDDAKAAITDARSYLTNATASQASELDELELHISSLQA